MEKLRRSDKRRKHKKRNFEILLNYHEVSKYYEHDCLQSFLSLFMSLSSTLIVGNNNILAGIYFIFLKNGPKLEGLPIPKLDLIEKIAEIVIK